MPSAIEYVPPTDTSRDNFSAVVTSERIMRRTDWRIANNYYMGNHDEQLDLDEDGTNDNVTINLVKAGADRTVSMLFPEMPQFRLKPDNIQLTPEEEWIKNLFLHNNGLDNLTLLALRGFLSGHIFLRVKAAKPFPKIYVLDPTTVTVYWSADNDAEVLWYEVRSWIGNQAVITDYVKNVDNDGGVSWVIFTYKSTSKVGDYYNSLEVPTRHGIGYKSVFSKQISISTPPLDTLEFGATKFELVGKPEIHPFEIPPIIEQPHLPHPNSRYGLMEFTQKDLQDSINKISSLRNQIIRESASPVDILTGSDIDDVVEGDGFLTVPSANARVTRLQLSGDLQALNTSLDTLITSFLTEMRVVLFRGGIKDLQRVTNASVRTLFLDALAKNQILKANYGSVLRKAVKLALLFGFRDKLIAKNPVNEVVHISWADPLPVDQLEVAQVNQISVVGGWMSKQQAATAQGLDWGVVQSNQQAEFQEGLDRQKQAMENMPVPEENQTEPANTQSTQENIDNSQ